MFSAVFVLEAILGLAVLSYVVTYLRRSQLRQFPGPLLARLSDWWRLYYTLDTHQVQLKLHQKYGSAVRIGPNCLILNDPDLIRTVYKTKGDFLKSDFYAVNAIEQGGHIIENIFSTRSNDWHRKFVRPISKIYSMNNILTLQTLADKTTSMYCKRLEEEFINGKNAGRRCNIVEWMEFYAWDVVGEVTFNEPVGFLEKGSDIDGMLKTADQALDYFATVGNMPTLDKWLAKNPYMRLGGPSIDWAGKYAAMRLFPRLQSGKTQDQKPDFLDHFIKLKEEFPDTVDDNVIIGYMLINLLAGADTTAITLRAIVYYLLKSPDAHGKAVQELLDARLAMPVQYADTEKLEYFKAVVREAMRLHPGIGMALERVVPAGGLPLRDGRVVPPGTIVGLNPWVIHRDRDVYGQDAEHFRPERWLKQDEESEEGFQARLKAMKDADLTFGAGNRVCIGKNLALMEVYKIIPTLLLKYDFKLAEPEREWKVKASWFMVQDRLDVTISRRGE